jgi:hypothetical protein
MFKCGRRLIVLLVLALAARPAAAGTVGSPTVSYQAFVPVTSNEGFYYHYQGGGGWTDSTGQHTVPAGLVNYTTDTGYVDGPLGFGEGGELDVTVTLQAALNGNVSGAAGTVTCEIYAEGVGASAGTSQPFVGSGTINYGNGNTIDFVIPTNMPPGAYFYSAECAMPPAPTYYHPVVGLLGMRVGNGTLEPEAGGGFYENFAAVNGGYIQNGVTYAAVPAWSYGAVTVSDTTGFFITSLGYFSGTTPALHAFGYQTSVNPPYEVCCNVYNVNNIGGLVIGACGSNSGYVSLPISGASGPGYYVALCSFPPGESLFGISPDVGNKVFFPPVAGPGFSPIARTTGIAYGEGWMYNGGSSQEDTFTSLGHGSGGPKMFNFAGFNNNSSTASCRVWAVNDTNGVTYYYTNTAKSGYGYYTEFVVANPPTGANYYYTAECSLSPGAELAGVYPSAAIYDPPATGGSSYQRVLNVPTGGTVQMHTCPPGYAMVGAAVGQNVFKCAPLSYTGGAVTVDTGTQRNGMHSCPPNSVMVGLHNDLNYLACQSLPSGYVANEHVDTSTQDGFPMHACDPAGVNGAMTGIRVDQDRLSCARALLVRNPEDL